MPSIIVITTTVEKKADAEKLVDVLFENKLIACAHVSGPVSSYYRWEGNMVSSVEYLLAVKSLESMSKQVVDMLSRHHPYDLPEITGTKLDLVKNEYAQWVEGEVR